MGFGAITECSIPLESSHRAGSNGVEHVAIAPKLKNPRPTKPSPSISICGGSSMGFDAITECSIPLESSHRAGCNGVEHGAITRKSKNPRPTKPFPTIFIFGGSSMGFGAITACSIPLESSHRAGSNGIEHVAITRKSKNPRPTKTFPNHFHIWGKLHGLWCYHRVLYTIRIVSSSRVQWCRARCNSTKAQKPAPHQAFPQPFPYLGVAPWVLVLSQRALYHWNPLIEPVPMV